MRRFIDFFKDQEKRTILFLILSGMSLIISFFGLFSLPVDAAWVAVVLCGIPILKDALVGLFTRFDIKADVLVSMALIASVWIGQIFAAGEVAFIMVIGALLEEHTVNKARAGIEKLVHLKPRTARILKDGGAEILPAEQVGKGDLLRVLAGESVPVDGVILSGQTSIDQSIMTGESLPVDKEAGDEVFCGTVNQFGTFDMKATKVGEDSSLQRMIRLVQSADAGKAKIVGIADRWATWIVLIALAAAALTFIVTGQIIRSVTILVVFCPCALVLATPTAIMAGIGNGTKYGILVREGDAMERLAKVSRIAFDKTGTLTYGKPAVVHMRSMDDHFPSEKLLAFIASAELKSEHPLGKAVVSYYKEQTGALPQEPSDFQLLAGRGVLARVGETEVLAGNEPMLREHGVSIPPEMEWAAKDDRNEGCTILYVAIDHRAAGILALSDALRSDAEETVKAIREIGVECVLLTGDNERAAAHMAKMADIETVHANCLPEDKMKIIEAYQNNKQQVCMVGDGINDAPSLKLAYVGIAMGGVGSDIAIDAADIALVRDDIAHLPHLLRLSRRMMHTIKLNLTFSMLLNFVAIVLAMIGILNPVLGALVHNAGSVFVVINSSLLLTWKKR